MIFDGEQTFAEEIEEAAEGEPIEAILIYRPPYVPSSADDKLKRTDLPFGMVLGWEQARHYLDYNYDRGFGTQECHSIIAWTASWVLYVDEYDGATSVGALPRNPPQD